MSSHDNQIVNYTSNNLTVYYSEGPKSFALLSVLSLAFDFPHEITDRLYLNNYQKARGSCQLFDLSMGLFRDFHLGPTGGQTHSLAYLSSIG